MTFDEVIKNSTHVVDTPAGKEQVFLTAYITAEDLHVCPSQLEYIGNQPNDRSVRSSPIRGSGYSNFQTVIMQTNNRCSTRPWLDVQSQNHSIRVLRQYFFPGRHQLSGSFPQLTHNSLEVVIAAKVNHDLAGFVFLQLDVDSSAQMLTQMILQRQHVIRQFRFGGFLFRSCCGQSGCPGLQNLANDFLGTAN
jgi:hypothetical protein